MGTTILVEGLKILFEHYGKPMASNIVVKARSALSEEVKTFSLAEEVTRRLRNTSTRILMERRISIQMKTSGHSRPFMTNVAIIGITNYVRMLKK